MLFAFKLHIQRDVIEEKCMSLNSVPHILLLSIVLFYIEMLYF